MCLITLQRNFKKWLREENADAAKRLGGGPGPGIYLNNHRASLMASLKASYGRVASWMGEAAFDAAAAYYVDAHAPHHWTLDAYGAHFPRLLSELHPDAPDIADMARLDWALGQIFIAADINALETAAIAAVDWDQAVLRLVPSAMLLGLDSEVDRLFEEDGPRTDAPEITASPQPVRLIVWRKGYAVHYRRLEAEEADWLPLLALGLPFAELCARLVAQRGEVTGIGQAGQWLARWTLDQLLLADVAPVTNS